MSISNALATVVSGLNATSRQAQVISSNVANATTPGYAKREVSLSPDDHGLGVKINGVIRTSDAFLTGNLRNATADVGYATALSDFFKFLEKVIGTPDNEASLSARVSHLEAAFITAASRPESEPNLIAAVNSAQNLASGLRDASNALQDQRSEADREISFAVDQLNFGLSRVEALNASIKSYSASGRDISALLDQRSQVIDSISELMPIQEINRSDGQVVLITKGGAILIDGRATKIDFKSSSYITSDMTISNGSLATLTLTDAAISTSGSGSLISGGKIGALFEIRDVHAVQSQARLDALARDLIERLDAADQSRAVSQAGLMTDAGNSFDANKEAGLAARITVNKLFDQSQGGSPLLLRNGIGSHSGQAVGSSSLLSAYSESLIAPRTSNSSSMSPAQRSLSGLTADILSLTAVQRLNEESQLSFAATRRAALEDIAGTRRVDLDVEIQSLMVIEKAYAANSKLLQALNEMLDTLLRI